MSWIWSYSMFRERHGAFVAYDITEPDALGPVPAWLEKVKFMAKNDNIITMLVCYMRPTHINHVAPNLGWVQSRPCRRPHQSEAAGITG